MVRPGRVAEGQEGKLDIGFGILRVRHEKERYVARLHQRTAGRRACDRRSDQQRQIEGFVPFDNVPRWSSFTRSLDYMPRGCGTRSEVANIIHAFRFLWNVVKVNNSLTDTAAAGA
jgi:hypothetical protein